MEFRSDKQTRLFDYNTALEKRNKQLNRMFVAHFSIYYENVSGYLNRNRYKYNNFCWWKQCNKMKLLIVLLVAVLSVSNFINSTGAVDCVKGLMPCPKHWPAGFGHGPACNPEGCTPVESDDLNHRDPIDEWNPAAQAVVSPTRPTSRI